MIDVSQEVHAAIGGWAIEYKLLMTQVAFDELERRVMTLVEAERARCAQACEAEAADATRVFGEWQDGAYACAARIRSLP
jgi:hypothetical protein